MPYKRGGGAVGNALPPDVANGVIFSSEAAGVGVPGTLASNGVVTVTPGIIDQALEGIYASGSKVVGDADLIAGNILSGKNIFGVAGSVEKILKADGAVLSSASASAFSIYGGGTQNSLFVQVTGLAFTPKIIKLVLQSDTRIQTYYSTIGNVPADRSIVVSTNNSLFSLSGNAYIGISFCLPITVDPQVTVLWYAYSW